jgi:cytochrome b pre-mRNA-processing protein 3
MLRYLFPRLTADPDRGAELFSAVTAEARARHWYVDGGVADTLDGRFAMLATIAALVLVRLEQAGGAAQNIAVALTERFIAVMESEHRELGLGDPKLGRTVRKLVGSLARRTDIWRDAASGVDWSEAVCDSVYGGPPSSSESLAHVADGLRALWSRLATSPVEALANGKLG